MAENSKDNPSRDYDVRACTPSGLSEAELAKCVAIVKNGDAVDPASAERELPLATALAIVRRGATIVGVGAIKRVRHKYAADIAGKSGIAFDRGTLELGYVVLDAKHRRQGLSHQIVAKLLSKHGGPLFATTDNDYMKRTLGGAGFVHTGREWTGEKGQLSLWIMG